jgi:hypothetical protein
MKNSVDGILFSIQLVSEMVRKKPTYRKRGLGLNQEKCRTKNGRKGYRGYGSKNCHGYQKKVKYVRATNSKGVLGWTRAGPKDSKVYRYLPKGGRAHGGQ